MDRQERIGVFGGTFDPIHIGHLVAAECARAACELDRVLFVVANDPWQKSSARIITSAEARLRMVEAAVADSPTLEPSDLEIRRGGATYTADTLAELAAANPAARLFLVGGADMASGLGTWERWQEVAALAEIAVLNRPGSPEALPGPPWRAHAVMMPNLDVSSSEIRRRIAAGATIRYLVPEPALMVIGAEGLYAGLQ